jgi:5-methylcytosine-specific restriction endonuclease McrA
MKRTRKNFFLPNDKCCYCDRPFREGLEFTKEHIIPVSNGGTDALSNLKPCCYECNQLRSNLDLKQFKTTVWNIIKILNGKYSISLKDMENIYENLRGV